MEFASGKWKFRKLSQGASPTFITTSGPSTNVFKDMKLHKLLQTVFVVLICLSM